MRYVVDTSVLVSVVANEPTKEDLISVTAGGELIAPASVHWEVGNALAAGLKRGRFSLSDARTAILSYNRISIRFVDVDLADALQLADQLKIYAYDAYVLACAQVQRCPLVSLDRGLLFSANALGLDVVEVLP